MIIDALKLKSIEAKLGFQKKFPLAHQFLLEKGLELGKLRQHSAKLISAGAFNWNFIAFITFFCRATSKSN